MAVAVVRPWRLAGIVLGVVVLASGMVAPAAWARAEGRPFAVTITVVQQGMPQRQWVDDDGVLHIRHQRFLDRVTGDLTGSQVSDANIDLDPRTGEGTGRASFVLTTDQGTWSGHFEGLIVAFAFSGHLEGLGTGAAAHTRIRGAFSQTQVNPQAFSLHGMISDIGGQK